MSITKDDLIESNRQLQIGEKVVLLGTDIAIPIDNSQLSFSFSQLVAYDENDQPIIQQLGFNGTTSVLTKKQIETDIVDIKSVVISISVNQANNFPDEALGIYTITNTISTNWNNYIWKNDNDYRIIKQDNYWVVEKDGIIYARNNTNNPLSNNWDNIINIEQTKFDKYQYISFFRCVNILDDYKKWTGVQCKFNKNTKRFVSLNKRKVFNVIDGFVPLQSCYYVVLDYQYILTQCNGFYYEDDETIIESSSSSESSSTIND